MGFVLFPVVFLSVPFPLRRRLKIICPVWQFCSRLLLRYGCSAHVDIEEDFRSQEFRKTPPYGLYISNHQSYIDIPLTFSIFQIPPIMKKEILFIPIFGWLAWISGALPVSRSSNNSRKKVFTQVRKRFREKKLGVQLYPEGTRSKDATPRQFQDIKRTLLVFAYNEKIPVIPASLYGTRGVLTKHGFIKPNRHIGIIVHKEIFPEDFQSADEFAKACWDKVCSGHDEIKRQLAPLNQN